MKKSATPPTVPSLQCGHHEAVIQPVAPTPLAKCYNRYNLHNKQRSTQVLPKRESPTPSTDDSFAGHTSALLGGPGWMKPVT